MVGMQAGSVVLDQAFYAPLWITPTYFMTTSLLKGAEVQDALNNLQERWLGQCYRTALFWVPVQCLMFSLVSEPMVTVYGDRCGCV